MKALLFLPLALLGGCQLLQGTVCAPKYMVVSCIEEARSVGEVPDPRLGPKCAQLESWTQMHGWLTAGNGY